MVANAALVPSFLSVTVAPLITAPDWSVTVPKMAPVSTCARSGEAAKKIRTTRGNTNPILQPTEDPILAFAFKASLLTSLAQKSKCDRLEALVHGRTRVEPAQKSSVRKDTFRMW